MQSPLRTPRKPSRIPDSIRRELNCYALSASAAGVGLLALSSPAEGRIVYTKTYHVVTRDRTYIIDLNHDGVGDFTLSNWYRCGDLCYPGFSVIPAKGNGAAGNHIHNAFALRRGYVINRKQFPFSGELMASALEGYGYWCNVANRYLGFKFQINGKNHYAWARLNVKVDGTTVVGTLTGYAYETISNKGIIAGKTKGADLIKMAAGQGGTLGHLALGRK